MKDLNNRNNLKSTGGVSKAMKTLQDLKKGKVGDMSFKNLKKLDAEFDCIRDVSQDFKDNIISKKEFETKMNVSEKLVSGILHANYVQKYNEESDANLTINRLPENKDERYNLAVGKKGEDALFENFHTVDDVLDRMKYLYG